MNLILIHPHELDSAGRVHLAGERAEHIRGVLRAMPGKTLKIGLLNGPKGTGTVASISGKDVILCCEFEEKIPPRPSIDLLLAVPRPKVMKRLWAQLAALGVGRIFLTNAEKVERYYFDSHVLEPDFYTARLIEGLQQAGDTLLPEVRIVRQLKPFLEDELGKIFPMSEPERSERGPAAFAAGQRPQGVATRVLADPSGTQNIFQCLDPKRSESAFGIPKEATMRECQTGEAGHVNFFQGSDPGEAREVPPQGRRSSAGARQKRILIAIGPEGGWTPYELELFAAHGFQVFNAGPRILRTDTVCVALLSLLSQFSHTCASVK